MKKTIKNTLLPLFLALCCLPAYSQKAVYSINLSSVEVSPTKTVSPGTGITNSELVSYADSIIDISWRYGGDALSFKLLNKSNQTIKIIWNDAAYIDSDGNTIKAMHNGVKFTSRNEDQPASSVIKGAKLSDSFYPTDYAYLADFGWRQKKLFSEYKPEREGNVGKHLKVLLPIMINEEKIEYIFDFEVKLAGKKK